MNGSAEIIKASPLKASVLRLNWTKWTTQLRGRRKCNEELPKSKMQLSSATTSEIQTNQFLGSWILGRILILIQRVPRTTSSPPPSPSSSQRCSGAIYTMLRKSVAMLQTNAIPFSLVESSSSAGAEVHVCWMLLVQRSRRGRGRSSSSSIIIIGHHAHQRPHKCFCHS